MDARKRIKNRAGAPVLLAHAVFTPGQPGWMDELEKAIALKPDAWKGYTLGDPQGRSKYPWRLNDEKLVYPAYEKIRRAGCCTICIHKELLPTDLRERLTRVQIVFAGVCDVGWAAKDWPDLNFVIYHSAIQKNLTTRQDLETFRATGRIPWVTDLAEIPEKYGVKNVYAEIGGVFANTAAANPELCGGCWEP